MKTCIVFLLSCLLFFHFEAQAQISASETTGCAPLVGVEFMSPVGATGISWDFGDAGSANIANPVHTFINPGTYNVTYSATVAGSPVNEALTITVYGNPIPGFTTSDPTVGCVGMTINFDDLSTGGGGVDITGWEWDFGDGGVDVSNDPTPTYTYNLPGSFDVSLNVTDINGCDSIIVLPDYITTSIPPAAFIVSNPVTTTACEPPLTVTFIGSNSFSNSTTSDELTFFWDFANGETSTEENPPPVTYTTNGFYLVQLTVTDDNGCSTTTGRAVSITEPLAAFTVVGAVNDTVCSFVTFINESSPGLYTWNYGDGTTGTDPFHGYTAPGPYDVNLSVASGACVNDTTIRIVVEQVIADFVSAPSYSCESPYEIQYTDLSTNAVSWLWRFGNDTINPVTSTAQNPVNVVYPLDTNQYTIWEEMVFSDTLTAFSEHGCFDTFIFEYNDTLDLLTSHFVPSTTQGCAPLFVTFADSSRSTDEIVSWMWDFGDGNTLDGDTLVEHTYTQPGNYNAILTVENSKGCIDTSYVIQINVGAPPSPDFSVFPIEVCPFEEVQFTDLTNAADSAEVWHFESDANLTWHCPFEANPTYGFMGQTGPQAITLHAGYNGCYNEFTIPEAITVKGPIARIEHFCNCENPYEYQFTANFMDADTWDWDFGDGTIYLDTTVVAPVHNYTASGDYWVKLTTYNATSGCAPFEDSLLIKVRNLSAAFTIPDTLACVGDTIIFNAMASQDVDASCGHGYQWFFDDGHHPINTDDPIKKYAFQGNGIHNVRLVTKDVNGCRDTTFLKVHTYLVQAVFSTDPDGVCLPLSVDFTDLSTGDTTLVSWNWSFGDGGGASEQHPTHIYENPPFFDEEIYVAQLTVQDVLGCGGIYYLPIAPSIPDPSFMATSDQTICVGESVSFAPLVPGMIYDWDFAGVGTATGPNPSYTFENVGAYPVSLQVTDSVGCQNSLTITNIVDVQGFPEAAYVSSADTIMNKCYPLLVNFTDTSLNDNFGGRTWDLGNGNPVISDETVGTLYDAPGDYSVTLTVQTSYGCEDEITKSLSIEGPLASISLSDDLICKGEDITFNIVDSVDVFTYSWDFGDGFDTTNVSPVTHTFNINPASGQTFASLVYWSPDSACSATATVPVFIHDVIADFNRNGETFAADTAHCIGLTDVFSNVSTNASNWMWDLGDGTMLTNSNPPPHEYTEPGTYNVSLSITNDDTGCVDEIVKPMVILPLPIVAAEDGFACLGDSLQLEATGGVTYTWMPSEGLSSPNVPNPIVNIDETMEYTVLVRDAAGCEAMTSAVANIFTPSPSFTIDTSIIIGDAIQLDVDLGEFYTYQWTPATGLSCTDCPNPIAMPLEDITYTVTIADIFDCFEVASFYNVEVLPVTSVDVPTAFTPNGDDINDVIYADGWGIKALISFKIYNRYGQLVFETSDIEEGWDGYFKGELQNVETYAYTVEVETWLPGGDILTKSGTFNLLR